MVATEAGAPGRDPLRRAVDLVLLAAAAACGVIGFMPIYGGADWVVPSVLGVAAGLGLAVLSARGRWNALVVAAAGAAAYAALSGLIFRELALLSCIPTPASVGAAFRGLVRGWRQVLTAVPPIGRTGEALAVPYLAAFVASLLAGVLALRTTRRRLAVVPLAGLVAVTILFGVREPANLAVQGIGFGAACVGWLARDRWRSTARGLRSRLAGSLAIVLIGCVAAPTLGDRLPGAESRRFILREETDPPFDPRAYPSPLAGFRRYKDVRKDRRGLKERTLFTVAGMPSDARIRMAVLDAYDGVVWSVSGSGTSATFDRVGSSIPHDSGGRAVTASFAIDSYDEIWLPTLGDVTGITFGGDRSKELTDALRVNQETDVAAAPVGLSRGDRVTVHARLAAAPDPSKLAGHAPGPAAVGPVEAAPDDVVQLVSAVLESPSGEGGSQAAPSASAESGFDRVRSIAETIRSAASPFYYSDGMTEAEEPSSPGHHRGRLGRLGKDYLDKGAAFGDGEQYAALLALVSRQLGVPSRVVMGFCASACASSGTTTKVTGDDVAAWVEVNVAGGGWVPLDVTPDPDKTVQPVQSRRAPNAATSSEPPVPPVTAPPAQDTKTHDQRDSKPAESEDGSFLSLAQLVRILGISSPFLLILGVLAGILGFKRRRRKRRRSSGTPRDQIIGGWSELRDLALDLGRPMPDLATRREAAALLGDDSVHHAADLADRAVFGPTPPAKVDAEVYWEAVGASLDALTGQLGMLTRLKVRLNPTSLVAAVRARRDRRALRRRDGRGGARTEARIAIRRRPQREKEEVLG